MPKPPKDIALSNFNGDRNAEQQSWRRPSIAPEVNVMRRASKSFENLIALANDQERLGAMSKVARKAVWRDTGEPPVQLDTLSECLEHASRGGLRESSSRPRLSHSVLPSTRGKSHRTGRLRGVMTLVKPLTGWHIFLSFPFYIQVPVFWRVQFVLASTFFYSYSELYALRSTCHPL